MTAKSRAQLNTDADTSINDNINGEISASDVRTLLKDVADSSFNLATDDINDVPGVGTAASADTGDFATAAQGALAGAALPAASYTAADILTKIKTVDGSGSGMDADLLDGNEAAAFATAAQGALADSAVQALADLGITATATEINYIDGVTSAIQGQIDGKQALDADLTALAAAGNSGVLAATTASFLTADEAKLDGIEALADVTDAANVAAAGAPIVVTPQHHGAVADGVIGTTGVATATDATFTDAGAAFVAGDVGKIIAINGAGTAGVVHSTTIASINSGTSIELTAAAVTTVASNASYTYGTSDTTAIKDACEAAMTAGVKVCVPAGNYLVATTVSPTMTGNLHVECDPGAVFIGHAALTDKVFNITSSTPYQYRGIWHGGEIDVSAVSSETGANAGTGLHLTGLGAGSEISGVLFQAGSDWEDLRGDTAIAPVNCVGLSIFNNKIIGWADCGIYQTGNSSAGTTDDGGPTFIYGNVIEKCSAGITSKRSGHDTIIFGNKLERCRIGIATLEADALQPGDRLTINGNIIHDSVARAIDLRGGLGLSIITNNRIEDWGYELNDVAYASVRLAIDLQGTENSIVSNNWIGLIGRANSSHKGIDLSNETVQAVTYTHGGNALHGNTFKGITNSISETAVGTANFARDNTHIGVTTPYTALSLGTVMADAANISDWRRYMSWVDDFTGDVLADQWTAFVGTDPQCVAAVVDQDANGEVVLVAGDDAGATMALNGSVLVSARNWRVSIGGLAIEARLHISAITDVCVFFGFTDNASSLEMPINSAASVNTLISTATNAVGVMFDTAMATDNWWLVGVDTDVDATHQNAGVAPVASTYETWRIELNTAGGAQFYRNGVLVGTLMADSTSASATLTPVLAIFSRTTATRTLTGDYIAIEVERV